MECFKTPWLLHLTSYIKGGQNSITEPLQGYFGDLSQNLRCFAHQNNITPTMEYLTHIYFLLFWIIFLICQVLTQDSAGSLQPEISYNVSEELQDGTFVGDMVKDADLKNRFGDDQVALMQFRFLSKPDLNLVVDADSGMIRTGGRIDRDELCPGKEDCLFKLDIVAIIPKTNFLEIIKATINVIDMNDNFPNFPQTQLFETILESADPGLSFRIPTAIDPDSSKLGIQQYVLEPESDLFKLVVNNKMDGSVEVRIVLEGELDRETRDTYEFKVVAYDGGDPPKSGSIDVLITVEDANDNDPIFDNVTYEVTLYENVPIHTTIIQVHATDKDSGSYGQVVYRFSPTTEENYGHLFGIVNTTGEVYVKGTIDYEISPIYHLSVSAYDRGPDSRPGDTTVIVRLRDINDNAPHITVNTLTATDTDTASIDEDVDLDTFLAHITVTDPDVGASGQFNCLLNDNHFSLEKLNKGEYKVVTKAYLDREKRANYNLAIECEDEGSQAQVALKHVHVTVTDINDNAPVFLQKSYATDILENNQIGAPIVQVNATDNDVGLNAEILYSVEESVQNTFNINPSTGAITAKIIFDREQDEQFRFKVFATDKGTPPQTSTTLVVVTINDVNDEVPKFSQPIYSFGILENQPIGTNVGIVHAIDRDSGIFNKFEFSFIPNQASMDHFAIDKETGEIITKSVLDRESQHSFSLTVLAADIGAPQISSTADVSIYVTDENDNEPYFEYPSKYNNTVYIGTRLPVAFKITQLRAHDKDIGKNSNLTYSIYDGNEKNYFKIDPITGAISLNTELKHITYEIFEFTVVVRDQGIPEKVGMGNLNIVVNRSIGIKQNDSGTLLGPNATIVISLSCVSCVIVLCLIVAIVVLRRADWRDKRYKGPKPLNPNNVESPKVQNHSPPKTTSIGFAPMLKKKLPSKTPPPPAQAQLSNGHAVGLGFESTDGKQRSSSPTKMQPVPAVSGPPPKYQVCTHAKNM